MSKGNRWSMNLSKNTKINSPLLPRHLKKTYLPSGRDALVNHLRLPFRHRKYVRTTNLVERSFEEEHRRTKIIPCFLADKSALKLVFSVLIRAAKRWHRANFTKTELNCLDRLREELEIREGFQNTKELKGYVDYVFDYPFYRKFWT